MTLESSQKHEQVSQWYGIMSYKSGDLKKYSILFPWIASIMKKYSGRSPAEILGSNPTGGMDICLLWVSCVVR